MSKKDKETKHITYGRDHYLIIRDEKGKPALGLAYGKNKILLEKGIEDEDSDTTYAFQDEDVLCNLGAEPTSGISVMGIKIEPFDQTIKIKNFGPLHMYRTLEEREQKYLIQVFAKAYELLDQKNITQFLPLHAMQYYNPRGKYEGSYTHKVSKSGDRLDSMMLRMVDPKDRKHNLYVILHELGHGVWFNMVPEDIKAKWIKLFSKRILLETVKPKTLGYMCEHVINAEGTFSDFIKASEDDADIILLKEIRKYIMRVHKLTTDEIDVLSVMQPEMIKEMWPEAQKLTTPETDISEYAMTNVKEFFAESFAFYMTERALPSDVTKGIEYTIKKAIRFK